MHPLGIKEQEMDKKQFKVVLPQDVKDWIAEQSRINLRSQSNEIILAIREKMQRQAGDETAQK